MTIKVCYNQASLLSARDCAVPIKVNGVVIGFIGIQHDNGLVEFYIETQPFACGVSDTREGCMDVSDSLVRNYSAKLASAFGVAEDEIEIEHEMTAEQKAWLSIDIEHEEDEDDGGEA